MPRSCQCQGGSCSCKVVAGAGASVAGTGTKNDPYVVGLASASQALLRVQDTDTVDLTLSGSGSAQDPLVLSAVSKHPASAISDTGWINITSGFAQGFTTGTTPGPLSYRIRDGIVYWRGGVSGAIPTSAYTMLVTALPTATRHKFPQPLRVGAAFSGSTPGFIEMHANGNLVAAHVAGANKTWVAFALSYPLDP